MRAVRVLAGWTQSERVVVWRADLLKKGEARPRYVWEVMVLIVVAHVESEAVEPSVVRVRLLRAREVGEDVML